MGKLETVRSKLDKKLFNTDVLGSNVTITPVSFDSGSFGGYSSQTETEGTPVQTVAVPYNKTKFSLSYRSFGDLEEGEIMMVFRYDTTIEKRYKVTYDSQEFRVVEKRDIPLNNGIAAIICKLKAEE